MRQNFIAYFHGLKLLLNFFLITLASDYLHVIPTGKSIYIYEDMSNICLAGKKVETGTCKTERFGNGVVGSCLNNLHKIIVRHSKHATNL